MLFHHILLFYFFCLLLANIEVHCQSIEHKEQKQNENNKEINEVGEGMTCCSPSRELNVNDNNTNNNTINTIPDDEVNNEK